MLGQNVDVSEIDEWLQADTSDRGYEHLSNAKIIAETISLPTSDAVGSDDKTEAVVMQKGDTNKSTLHKHIITAPCIVTHNHPHISNYTPGLSWLLM